MAIDGAGSDLPGASGKSGVEVKNKIVFLAFTMLPWGIALVARMLSLQVNFDGKSFMYACVATGLLMTLVSKPQESGAFDRLLIVQSAVNIIGALVMLFGFSIGVARTIAALGVILVVLAVARVAFRMRR